MHTHCADIMICTVCTACTDALSSAGMCGRGYRDMYTRPGKTTLSDLVTIAIPYADTGSQIWDITVESQCRTN